MTPASLRHLTHLPQLHTLSLWETGVAQSDLTTLTEALPALHPLDRQCLVETGRAINTGTFAFRSADTAFSPFN